MATKKLEVEVGMFVKISGDSLTNELVWALTNEQIMELILDLDDKVADYNFTKKLIKRLKKSLKDDK